MKHSASTSKEEQRRIPPQIQTGLLLQQQLQCRPCLTCLSVLKGVLALAILVCSAFVTLICLAPITFLGFRLISVHWSRTAISIIFGHWLAIWPFFFEKVNKTKVIFAGDQVPAGERVMVLCNHRTEVDWMYIWSLALRKNSIGHVKYVLKSSVRNVPVFGWAFHVLEFLLIDRNWQLDEPVFASLLSTFKNPQDPLWLVIFPEGTDYSEEKCLRSQKFAEDHGLPKLSHVLLPRTKGFYACLSHLHGSLDAVYDLTIGYRNRLPLFLDNAFGMDPLEVHIHVKRIPISDIPLTENESSAWIFEEYARKDKLLSYFYREGTFPDSGTEGELSMSTGIINLCMILASTCVISSLVFFSSVWIKVYIALSCVYLATATYFNHKPLPILRDQSAKALSK